MTTALSPVIASCLEKAAVDIVRKNDEKACGEYRTKRVILEIYDAMAEAVCTGKPYQTRLDPPPADPLVAHSESTRPPWAKKGSP